MEVLKAGVSVDVKRITAALLAERIQHVLDTNMYHDAAERLAAEIAELSLITELPEHLVSAV